MVPKSKTMKILNEHKCLCRTAISRQLFRA